MGNPSTRLFINNLDNRYNYVNLTEGKRRVSTLLREKKASNSQHGATAVQRFFFLSLSLSPFVYALRRFRSQFKTRFAFFYESCYLGRERRDSYRFLASFLPSFFRRFSNEIVEKITSIFEILFDYQKKKQIRSRTTHYIYIYIIPRKRITISIRGNTSTRKSTYQEGELEFLGTLTAAVPNDAFSGLVTGTKTKPSINRDLPSNSRLVNKYK